MSKQNEMVEQLKLLMSKYEHWADNPYSDHEIFQQRYIEISNTIAKWRTGNIISNTKLFRAPAAAPRGYGFGGTGPKEAGCTIIEFKG